MLAVSTRMEQKDGQQRPVNRTYYYVDFRAAIDAIKYKMHEVTKELEKKMNKDADTKGYVCPRCDKQFTALDAMTLLNQFGMFECDRCSAELVDDNDSAEVQTSQERLGRFNDQTKKVLQLLRQIDEVVVPASSFEDAFAKAIPVSREKHGLINGTSNMPQQTKQHNVTISQAPTVLEVQISDNGEKSSAELAAEQAKKFAQQNQNALPIWHTTSTVTGDITSAGIKEQTERKERERQLQGLGAGVADTDDGKSKTEADADSALSADAVAQFYADFERREKEKQQEEDEEEEDEDEDEDDEEFVEVMPATIPTLPPSYNNKTDDSDGTGTPGGDDDRPNKRTKVEDNEDSEEEEADFEDAL